MKITFLLKFGVNFEKLTHSYALHTKMCKEIGTIDIYKKKKRLILLPMFAVRPETSGGIKGSNGHFSTQSEAPCPPCPQSDEKNGRNQPFSANFWIIVTSESHLFPSMPPTKNSGATGLDKKFLILLAADLVLEE